MPMLDRGATVGKWTVVAFVERGGNGEVYEVTDTDGNRAALKLLSDGRPDRIPYARFVREIAVVRDLAGTPGVLPIVDAHLPTVPGRRDRPWYVMPRATPVSDAFAEAGVTAVVAAVAHLAEALAQVHDDGLAHRDLKPANILVLEGTAMLADFGLVHIPESDGLTPPDRVAGSMGYIADEVMMALGEPDWAAADTYALGKVLWRLLTPGAMFPPGGQLRADGGAGTLARSLTVPGADVLHRVLARATAPLPNRLSMGAFRSELRHWLALPAPTSLGPDAELALADARTAFAPQLVARASAEEHARVARSAGEALRARTAAVIEAVRGLDPTGCQTGPLAAQALHHSLVAPAETGQPDWGEPMLRAVRIARTDGWRDEVLLVAFCLQIAPDDAGRVTGVLLAGHEGSNNCTFVMLETKHALVGVALEAAIDELAAEAALALPDLVRAWTARVIRTDD